MRTRIAFAFGLVQLGVTIAALAQPAGKLIIYARRTSQEHPFSHAWLIVTTPSSGGPRSTIWSFGPNSHEHSLVTIPVWITKIKDYVGPSGQAYLSQLEFGLREVAWPAELAHDLDGGNERALSEATSIFQADLTGQQLQDVKATIGGYAARVASGTLTYNAFTQNCTSFVADVAGAAGLRVPARLLTLRPAAYVDALQIVNGRASPQQLGGLARGSGTVIAEHQQTWTSAIEKTNSDFALSCQTREQERQAVLNQSFLNNWQTSREEKMKYEQWSAAVQGFSQSVSSQSLSVPLVPAKSWRGEIETYAPSTRH